MKDENLIKARAVLKVFWDSAMLKGRCWGLKKIESNFYRGSHITMANGRELVSISQDPDGKLVFHEFVRTDCTVLGSEMKEILKSNDLSFK